MRWAIHVLISAAVVTCLGVVVAHGQAPKAGSAQKSLEVPLQQRVAALEKEVQSLKAELAALRAQIQRGGSTQTPVASGSGSTARSDGARPSEAEIRACVAAAPTQIGGTYGFISGPIEFGTMITSQGGMMEMAAGAPKGTSIFPIRINETDRSMVWEFWAFKDSFGKLKCVRI